MKKQNWINLLMENGGNTEEFEAIQANSRTELFGLCKYKKILRQRGRGRVEFTEIEKSYANNDISELHKLLNKLFLEYYTDSEMNTFLESMKETGTSISEIYSRHIESPENTLLSHITL